MDDMSYQPDPMTPSSQGSHDQPTHAPTPPPSTTLPSAAQQPSPPQRSSRSRGRRFTDLLAAGILGAALASGGTYAAITLGDRIDESRDGSSVTSQEAQSGQDNAPAAGANAQDSGSETGQASTVTLTGEHDWSSIAAAVSPAVVSIAVAGQLGSGSGSGVIWDSEGHIVTNAHVVEGAREVQVTLNDGRSYSARVIGADPSSDLAVLALDTVPESVQPITVGDDSALSVGDPVMAVGNPLGLSGTVTTGIVSALDRPVTTQASSQSGSAAAQVVTNAIQTSAAINPGNSGGALVNGAGELVGINSSIATLSSGFGGQSGSIGIGFAIPAVKVSLIAEQLIETGTAQHAFLGVGLGDGSAHYDGATLTGALVRTVEPGSPAEQAGIQVGDLILAIDDEQVPSSTALVGQVRERGAGQSATLELVREGALQQVDVELAIRPDQN